MSLMVEQTVDWFDQPIQTVANFIVPPINWSTISFVNPKHLTGCSVYEISVQFLVFWHNT